MSLTSQIAYVRAYDSAATDGSGKTGLAFGDFTAKYLTEGGTLTSLTPETITTLGTYQAPTDASHIRIKELSSSDPCKGVYEVHFHNTQVAVAGAKLWLFLSASGAAIQPLELDLITTAALPSAAPNANGGLPVLSSSGTTLAYTLSTLTTYTGNTVQTGDAYAVVNSGTFGNAAIKGYVDDIGIAGAGLTALGDTRLAHLDADISSRGTSTLTQTQVTGGAYSVQSASCVLGDARVANLDATVSSRGTSTLTQAQVTGGAYSVQSSSCVLGDARVAHLDADVTSRMATYTQPTGFLAATFPGTVASTTNITAGTITTVTNLTNAPTAGDLTATMKTSVTTAATAATPAVTVSDKTGFSLTSGERNSIAAALLDLAAGVETGMTPRQALRLMLAALVGKLSGAATTTISIRDTGDSKNRVVATVDADGNRAAVTLDAT